MECSEPGIIHDEELIAYLAGEKVRPIVGQHVARCQRCSSLLATYQQIDHKVTRNLYRFDCPPGQILGEYQLGLLDSTMAAQVKAHLSWCELCGAEVASLTAFLAQDPLPVEVSPVYTRDSVSLPELSPTQEARQIWEQARDHVKMGVRRIIDTLLPQQPRVAYLRDATRQIAHWPRRYEAEDVSVSLQLEQIPGHTNTWQLIGLVKRNGVSLSALNGIPVQLSSSPQTLYTQQIDDLGNFVFAELVPATYTLEVQFPGETIVIEQLAITAQS